MKLADFKTNKKIRGQLKEESRKRGELALETIEADLHCEEEEKSLGQILLEEILEQKK